jgi:hypothetical protein
LAFLLVILAVSLVKVHTAFWREQLVMEQGQIANLNVLIVALGSEPSLSAI